VTLRDRQRNVRELASGKERAANITVRQHSDESRLIVDDAADACSTAIDHFQSMKDC
jgi:hypothetical protein